MAQVVRKHTCLEKFKDHTLFNVRIYVDISESVTACSLGTSLVSSFSILDPGPQNA